VHPVAYVAVNEYNNPWFATMIERVLLNTYITTCFGLNPGHQQIYVFNKTRSNIVANEGLLYSFIVTRKSLYLYVRQARIGSVGIETI
jgi:hypothetical protein